MDFSSPFLPVLHQCTLLHNLVVTLAAAAGGGGGVSTNTILNSSFSLQWFGCMEKELWKIVPKMAVVVMMMKSIEWRGEFNFLIYAPFVMVISFSPFNFNCLCLNTCIHVKTKHVVHGKKLCVCVRKLFPLFFPSSFYPTLSIIFSVWLFLFLPTTANPTRET